MRENQLLTILENIRVELNLQRNNNIFMDTWKIFLTTYEKSLCYTGLNVEGLTNELFNDDNFKMD